MTPKSNASPQTPTNLHTIWKFSLLLFKSLSLSLLDMEKEDVEVFIFFEGFPIKAVHSLGNVY